MLETGFLRGGVLKAGAGLALASPFIKGGINYAKKKATDPNNLKRLTNLKNKLFKRFDQPVRPKYPLMNRHAQRNWNAANPGKWLYDKWKLTGWGGAGGLSLMELMDQMRGEEVDPNAEKNDFINKSALENQRLMENEAYGGPRGEDWSFVPKKELTNMEKFGKNIKDPKWWMESMGGDKTDTRLMRLGQLMDLLW